MVFRTITAIVELSRPINVIMTMGAVWLGAWMAGQRLPDQALFLASVAAALVCAGANAYNDYLDYPSDRYNHPRRPVPSGRLTPATAWWCWCLASLAGAAVGYALGRQAVMIVDGAILALWLYTRRVKQVALAGHVMVALCGGLAVLLGAVVGGHPAAAVIPMLFALDVHVARELIKAAEDRDGDRTAGIRTFPEVFGIQATRALVSCLLLALIPGLLLPWLWAGFSTWYLLTALAGAGLPGVYVAWSFSRDAGRNNAHRLSQLLKGALGAGMAALMLA